MLDPVKSFCRDADWGGGMRKPISLAAHLFPCVSSISFVYKGPPFFEIIK